jgi:hypothetical protein
VAVDVPKAPFFPTYNLEGPGIAGADGTISRTEGQAELSVPQAVLPGNYKVVGGDGKPVGAFSLNIPSEECQLARLSADKIEALLGPNALIPLDQQASLQRALQSRWSQPVELLPWLMMAVLFALAIENFLANRFYRRTEEDEIAEQKPQAVDTSGAGSALES